VTNCCEYRLFGLRVRSEIPLPDLFPAEEAGPPDVTIRKAALRCAGHEEGLAKDGDALVLTIPEVATYRIANGDEILVDAAPDVPDRNVRLFLLGSAFGALLHQRGLLPLHANAIEIDGKAIAFMGESGAGKSTLAAWFHDKGFRVIADDVCVVRFDDTGSPRAVPGLPRLRLWAEALAQMGRDASGFARSYIGVDDEKYDVPIDRELAAGTDLRLARLYVLDRANEFSISPVGGLAAAEAVFANTYRGWYASAAGTGQSHWHSAINLVHRLPVMRVSRPWDLSLLDEHGMRLLDHVREQTNVEPLQAMEQRA
jgi:hypothetical protein